VRESAREKYRLRDIYKTEREREGKRERGRYSQTGHLIEDLRYRNSVTHKVSCRKV
jgi:hypothetical protein